jgi:hypothetical protein
MRAVEKRTIYGIIETVKHNILMNTKEKEINNDRQKKSI